MSKLLSSFANAIPSMSQIKVDKDDEEVDSFTLSDETRNKISRTHDHTHDRDHESFDEDSLFIITQNILNRAIQIIDRVVQGSSGHVEKYNEKNPPNPNFTAPLCELKSISSMLSCKKPGVGIARKTAFSILEKLSGYKWEAKAVVTLAAFAYDFGDFWLFADRFESDALVNQFALLKNVPQLIKKGELQKHGHEIRDVSSLIKKTMSVIAIFDEFEKLSRPYTTRDIPELQSAFDSIQEDAYWTIVTIAAISTKISILTCDMPDQKPYDIAPYALHIQSIFKKLDKNLGVCKAKADEIVAFNKISKMFSTRTEILVAFKELIFFTKGSVEPLFNGSTNKSEDIDVVRGKNLFLFFSTLDITKEDIELVKSVYVKAEEEESYRIVWVPIVEEWSEDLWSKIDHQRVQFEMPWYIVQQRKSSVAGIRYIKKEWKFKDKPILVKINPLSEVTDKNAIYTINRFGVDALFGKRVVESNWFASVIKSIKDSVLKTWIKDEKYIFLYGGEDTKLIQHFEEMFHTSKEKPTFKEIVKINIETFHVGKTEKGVEDRGIVERFWKDIQEFLINKAEKLQFDQVTQDIQKLLSYKKKAWAVLIKGSTLITQGHGSAMLEVLKDVQKWEKAVKEKDFNFETFFKVQISEASKKLPHCYEFNLSIDVGDAVTNMECPECHGSMATEIIYKCCPTANAHH